MKKLLYITVNSKDEAQSSCKTVGRRVVNAIIQKYSEVQLEELDLYKYPTIKGMLFRKQKCHC